MGSPSQLLKVLSSSVAIANRAGAVIRGIMKSGKLDVVDKDASGYDYDPQTEADRAAQKLIVGSLERSYPGLCVIGEEDNIGDAQADMLVSDLDPDVLKQSLPKSLAGLKLEDLVVWVDPLDGTKEFTEGNVDHVTVLIGISARGRAVAGVVHQPFYAMTSPNPGRTLWGVVELGLFGARKAEPQPNRRIITTTKSHGNTNVNSSIEAMMPTHVLHTGGAGYKVLLVLEGMADAYVFASPGSKKWDTCAPEALIRASGGHLTDALGSNIDYSQVDKNYHMNWTGIIVSLINHDYYVQHIPEEVRQNLLGLFKSKTSSCMS